MSDVVSNTQSLTEVHELVTLMNSAKSARMPIIRFCQMGSDSLVESTRLDQNENAIPVKTIQPLTNGVKFSFEVVDGGLLQVGDEIQLCSYKLVTHNEGKVRKYRLRSQHSETVVENGKKEGWIVCNPDPLSSKYKQLFFHNNSRDKGCYRTTLYLRIRRKISDNSYVFSNAVPINIAYNLWDKSIRIV